MVPCDGIATSNRFAILDCQSLSPDCDNPELEKVNDKAAVQVQSVAGQGRSRRLRRKPAKKIHAMNALLKVNVALDGKDTLCSYDGGAEVSLIRKEDFDRLPEHVLGKSLKSPRLQDVQENDIRTYGTRLIKLSVAGQDLVNKFTIVDTLGTPLLLGRDFCSMHDVTVSHKGPRFWIGKVELPVSSTHQAPSINSKSPSSPIFSFTVAKATGIPPLSSKLVRIRSTRPLPDTELLVSPQCGGKPIAICQLVQTCNSEALVQLDNYSLKPLRLWPEQTIAQGSSVEHDVKLINVIQDKGESVNKYQEIKKIAHFRTDNNRKIIDIHKIENNKKNFDIRKIEYTDIDKTQKKNPVSKTESREEDNINLDASINQHAKVGVEGNIKADLQVEEEFDPSNEEHKKVMENLKLVHIGPLADTEDKKRKVMALLWKHRKVFSTGPWDLGLCSLPGAEHKMKLKPGSKPVKSKPYRPCLADREDLRNHVMEMSKAGLVVPSSSSYGSPMYLIRKQKEANGTTKTYKRIIVNMKGVNAQLEGTAQFLPRMDDLLDKFAGKTCFSNLDLTQFYFQIPLDQASRELCAFCTVDGLYEPTRLAAGDASAPNHAQAVISKVLDGVDDASVLLDDVGLCSNGFDPMLSKLDEVFTRLRSANLKVKPGKCHLFQKRLNFLGHTLEDGKLCQSDDKIDKVKTWPRPRNAKEIAGFLGFLGFWRQFLKDLSPMMKPLLSLQKAHPKGMFKKGVWTEEHEKTFQSLKELATTAPFLKLFDHNGGRAHLYVDASESGIGACLAQEVKEASGRTIQMPVCYASRLYRGPESRYSMNEKEGLAAVWAIRKFRIYLLGRGFALHTDSQTVYHMLKPNACDLNKRLGRFAALVAAYNFSVYLIKGKDNVVADALSRLPVVKDTNTGELKYRKDEEFCYEKITDESGIDMEIDDKDDPEAVVAAVTRMKAKLEGYDNVREEQQKDDDLKPIIAALRRNNNEALKEGQLSFFLKNGYLFVKDSLKRERVYLPKSIVPGLLHDRHSLPHTGHPGTVKLYNDLSQKFYWKNMRDDIDRYVQRCDPCQRVKMSFRHVRPPLKHLPRPTRGWQVFACDVLGPFRGAKEKYVFLITDLFTKFAWAKALTVQTGENIAKFLVETVFQFGRPACVISDQAPQLDAGIVAELYKMYGIDKKRSSPFFASGNGAAERLCGTVGNMIRLAVETDKRAWPDYLQLLINTYNQSYHRAVKEKPVVLAFGIEPENMDSLYPTEHEEFSNPSMYARSLIERKEKAAKVALKHLEKYYQGSKTYFDKKNNTAHHNFDIGQWVLVRIKHIDPSQGKKLGARYFGPAEILEVDEHVAKIRFIANGFTRRRNVSHLRPYYFDKNKLPELAIRFTAPKRRNRRFDNGSLNDGDAVSNLFVGLSPDSPYSELLGLRPSQEDPSMDNNVDIVDDEDNEVQNNGVGKTVHFNDEDTIIGKIQTV